jgi:hypothetical protein
MCHEQCPFSERDSGPVSLCKRTKISMRLIMPCCAHLVLLQYLQNPGAVAKAIAQSLAQAQVWGRGCMCRLPCMSA